MSTYAHEVVGYTVGTRPRLWFESGADPLLLSVITSYYNIGSLSYSVGQFCTQIKSLRSRSG